MFIMQFIKYNSDMILSMKIILFIHVVIFLTLNLYADKNWIEIQPMDKAQTIKSSNKIDINLSQIEPINKMMKNVAVIKQLIGATTKKKKVATNDKNWFLLSPKNSK